MNFTQLKTKAKGLFASKQEQAQAAPATAAAYSSDDVRRAQEALRDLGYVYQQGGAYPGEEKFRNVLQDYLKTDAAGNVTGMVSLHLDKGGKTGLVEDGIVTVAYDEDLLKKTGRIASLADFVAKTQINQETLALNLADRRQWILQAFRLAAEQDSATAEQRVVTAEKFDNAVTEVSANLALFVSGFADYKKQYEFGAFVATGLKEIAANSSSTGLRKRAIEGIAATSVLNPDAVQAVYDIGSLVLYAVKNADMDPATRAQAVKGIADIVSSKKLVQLQSRSLSIFPQGYVVRAADDFRVKYWNEQAPYQEYALGVAAHILKTDPDVAVRKAAAQALRDIAASDKKTYQPLADFYASESRGRETAPEVKAVLQAIEDDAGQAKTGFYAARTPLPR